MLTTRVPPEFFESLTSMVTPEEIKKAIFSIGKDKAPGPDGYNSFSFQENWEVVGPDVITAVQAFFVTSSMPGGWNATILSLVPKVGSPINMKDFRPITCCNDLYKCITKVLANRMQGLLPLIINQAHSALSRVGPLQIISC